MSRAAQEPPPRPPRHGATTTTAHGATTTTAHGATTTTSAHSRSSGGSTTTTLPRSSLSVVVANGTSTSGLAAHYTTEIGAAGYAMKTPLDTTTPQTTSAVYYASGQQAAASSIAASIGVKPSEVQPLTTSVPVNGVTGSDVVVVIGQDLASSTTTTTASS